MTKRTRTMTSLADPLTGVLTSWERWSSKTSTTFNAVNQQNVGKTTIDVVTPNYFKLKKSGAKLPVNPFTTVETIVEGTDLDATWAYGMFNADGSLRKEEHASFTRFQGCLARYLLPVSISIPTAVKSLASSTALPMVSQEALAAARTKSWDFLTFLAEFHKTSDLVRNVANRTVKRAAKIYKHGRPATVTSFLDMWMEGRYGWRLLAYDIKDVNSAITRLIDGYPEVFRSSKDYIEPITSTTTSVYKDTLYWKSANGSSNMIGTNVSTMLTKTSAKYNRIRCGVAVLNEGRGLAFADPLVTGFEIIPLSMILDWFTNVQDLLTAWSPFATQSVAWNFAKVTTVVETKYVAHPVSRDSIVLNQNRARLVSSSSDSYLSLRAERSERFQPPLELSLQFRNSFDWPKAIDLVAILATRTKALKLFFTQSYYAPRSPLEDYVRRVL